MIKTITIMMFRDIHKIVINNIKDETVICNNNIWFNSKDKVHNIMYLKLLKVKVQGRQKKIHMIIIKPTESLELVI